MSKTTRPTFALLGVITLCAACGKTPGPAPYWSQVQDAGSWMGDTGGEVARDIAVVANGGTAVDEDASPTATHGHVATTGDGELPEGDHG